MSLSGDVIVLAVVALVFLGCAVAFFMASKRIFNASFERGGIRPQRCEAFQMSDSMVCHRCRKMWDAGDPSPPPCSGAET